MKNKAKPSITRRDFLNGVALGVAAGSGLSPLELLAQSGGQAASLSGSYPPALQGLRGSHVGSFETGHAMRDGQSWTSSDAGDGQYDLVVVGGGISGLAAAYFYRKQNGPQSRILILDNHDDFGGHAKRNEFRYGDRLYLVNGGTLNVEAPSQYSTVAAGLLWSWVLIALAILKRTGTCSRFTGTADCRGAVFLIANLSVRTSWSWAMTTCRLRRPLLNLP